MNPRRQGTEGGRFTDSTEDPGPKKPGNRVEDKTLEIREERMDNEQGKGNPPFMTVNTHRNLTTELSATDLNEPIASLVHGKRWTKDDGGTVGEPK